MDKQRKTQQFGSSATQRASMLEPLAYTVADASRVSSIGKTRLYALKKEGKLKMIKVGSRTLVDAASLRELLCLGS